MVLPQDFKDKMQGLLKDEFEDFLKGYDKDNFYSLRINTINPFGQSICHDNFFEQPPHEILGTDNNIVPVDVEFLMKLRNQIAGAFDGPGKECR